jgi:hypothetical protein
MMANRSFSLMGDVISPGDLTVQEANQSELAGLMSTVSLVKAIVSFYKEEEGSVMVGCDGLYVLLNSFDSL